MPDRFIAMLMLSESATPDPEAILAEFQRRVPNFPSEVEVVDAPDGGSKPGSALLFKVDDLLLSVVPVDKPLPAGTLDDAIAADRMWPDARDKLSAHKAHVIVGAITEATDYASAINIAGLVTAFAATITAMTPTIGVYWSNGKTITEKSRFLEVADGFFAGQPPATVWVQLLWLDGPPTSEGEPTFAVVTTGLQPFVGYEIEFLPAPLRPRTIAERMFGTVIYLLSKGPVLKDGDSLGVSAEECIRIAFANRGQRPGVPVIKLTIERLNGNGAIAGREAPGGSTGRFTG